MAQLNAMRSGPTLAERQAKWICGLTFDDIPAIVRERAKLLLMDFLGVARLGATLPQVEPARALLADMGGAAQASVMGSEIKTSAAYAALANGVFGHACEYDDAHWNCGHPGVCVIPAVLALAEREGSDGKDILTAIVAGYHRWFEIEALDQGGSALTLLRSPFMRGRGGCWPPMASLPV